MAPPLRYTDAALETALRASPSLKAASELSGMSQGALRRRGQRATASPTLKRAWSECRTRGIANTGPRRKRAW